MKINIFPHFLVGLVYLTEVWNIPFFFSLAASLSLYLGIEREVIESHGTDEVDVGGLRVHDLLISGDPQPRVFRQHLHHLECLQVVDEDVRQPKLFDQLQVDGNESIRSLFWKFVCLYDD